MSPSPRRRQLRRFRTSLASVLAALLVAVLIGPLAQLAPSYAGPAAQVGSTSTGQQTALARSVCGTWVLYQVSDARSLRILRPKIANALALPGVVGLSVRFPWEAVDLRGREKSHPILRTARRIASRAGKGLSIRFMAGTHTPERVFRAGASYYRVGGQRAPLAFDNGTGRHAVFVRAYEKYVHKLAAWSRRNDVRLLHLSWYGEDWSELNHGAAVRAAPGYTERKWLRGHRQLVRIGAENTSRRLAVELPLSGYGPLSEGQSAALAKSVVRSVGRNSPRFFVQANGWDETREWGSPTMLVERHFDRIWRRPVMRGLQMIQPDGYRWKRVFARLDSSRATYAEVYLPSFWQVPGPTAQFDHNTRARIAGLEKQIRKFHHRTC